MRMIRRLGIAAVAVAATTITLALSAMAASHYGPLKSSCLGTRQESYTIRDAGGTAIGRVELWYRNVSGGENCVITYNYGSGTQYTETQLWIDDNNDGDWDRTSWDRGNYFSYAGASYRTNTNGKCVWVYGKVTSRWNGSKKWVHCG